MVDIINNTEYDFVMLLDKAKLEFIRDSIQESKNPLKGVILNKIDTELSSIEGLELEEDYLEK